MDCHEDSTVSDPRDNPNEAPVECLVYDLSTANVWPEGRSELLPRLSTDMIAELIARGTSYETEMQPFWDGYRQHFAALGIALCELRAQYWILPGTAASAPLPFAIRCLHQNTALSSDILMPKLGSAQDIWGRDLVIKLVDKGTAEHDIYHYLAKCNALYSSRVFPCVLPPTTIVESPHRFAFVFMPRWGDDYGIRDFNTIGQIMTFIKCTLTGLAFLHEHRIAHRDIHETNIAVNWYCCDHKSTVHCRSRYLLEHYSSPTASYALYDFDLALQLPPETCLRSCRRPAEEAVTGKKDYHPADIYQGEADYNPFAFDVACLGNLFLTHFAEAIPVVPLLAPLIGGMTTHVIDSRFTAEEALAFADELKAELPPDIRNTPITLQVDYSPLDDPRLYWARVSPQFMALWKSYQPPPLTWIRRVLFLANSTYAGWKFVSAFRRLLHV